MIKIEMDKIEKLLTEIEIPTLPSIASAVMQKTMDEKTSAKQLADMVEKDQALASKVLRVANSPFYRRIKEVSSIRHAVVLLGLNVLKSIVLSISVINMFDNKNKNAIDLFLFWQHSIACAVSARMIANKSFPALAEDAFAAGLLHDLGKVVIDQGICKGGEYAEVLALMEKGGRDIVSSEHKIIGIDHAYLGRRLMEKWNLPALTGEVVGAHHTVPEGSIKDSDAKCLSAILYVADLITNHLGLGICKLSMGFIDPAVLKQLNLSSHDIQEMSVQLKENIATISDELGIPKAEPKTYFEVLQSANAKLGKLSLDLEQKKLALERRATELTGLNKMSSQLQAAMKISDIMNVITTNTLNIIGAKKVRCMIRINNQRVMVTDSFLAEDQVQTKSGVAGATKELLDRTYGAYPKGARVMFAPIKVEDAVIGVIEATPGDTQHEDNVQKSLLLRTIADVGAQAIARATVVTKNIKNERLAAVSKTAIAANHEINSPLTTIILNLDTLLSESTLKDRAAGLVRDVKAEALKIRSVVKKMLEISDVVDMDYIKTAAKTEKMLDINKGAGSPSQPAAGREMEDDNAIAGFEDYLPDDHKKAVPSPPPPGREMQNDTPGFEDYLPQEKKPVAAASQTDAAAMPDATPGFEDYLPQDRKTAAAAPKPDSSSTPDTTPGFEDYLPEVKSKTPAKEKAQQQGGRDEFLGFDEDPPEKNPQESKRESAPKQDNVDKFKAVGDPFTDNGAAGPEPETIQQMGSEDAFTGFGDSFQNDSQASSEPEFVEQGEGDIFSDSDDSFLDADDPFLK